MKLRTLRIQPMAVRCSVECVVRSRITHCVHACGCLHNRKTPGFPCKNAGSATR